MSGIANALFPKFPREREEDRADNEPNKAEHLEATAAQIRPSRT
jgi:hypothetical protein